MEGLLAVYLLALAVPVIGCAFGTRAVMKNKGRSGTAGFFMGFFLGLIGLLIAALLPMTPEYEVYRMQRQMHLMNAATQGMQPGAVPGTLPLDLPAPPKRERGPMSLRTLATLCTASAVMYAVAAYMWPRSVIAEGVDPSGYRILVPLVCVGVLALIAIGLRQNSEMLTMAALGAMFGVAAFSLSSSIDEWTVRMADTMLLVAVCIAVLQRGSRIRVPRWWNLMWVALLATTVPATIDVTSVNLHHLTPDIGAPAVVVIVVAAIRRTERSIYIIGGWGLTAMLRLLTWIGPTHHSDWRSPTGVMWVKVMAVLAGGMGVGVVSLIRQGTAIQSASATNTASAAFEPPSSRPMIPTDPLMQAPPPPPPPPPPNWP